MSVFKPIPLLRICTLCLLATFFVDSYASPAYRGPVTMTQPDGSTFVARLTGDEFIKIKTTTTGHAIIQGDDGWWYYGIYDESARLTNSGIKVVTKLLSTSFKEFTSPIIRARILPVGLLSKNANDNV